MTTAQTAQGSTDTRVLYMALERGWHDWTVGCTSGLGQAPRQVSVRARALHGLLAQIAQAKRRFGLAADVSVQCVYEAGRAGFWLHRFLRAHGLQTLVGDAASSEVPRRYRRSKTDRLDRQTLLTMLVRFVLGETRLWKVVRGPAAADEALGQPHREIIALKEERPPHMNRLKGLLAGKGLEAVIAHTFPERLQALRQWAGQPVPAMLQARLRREFARWALGQRQSQALENAAARMVRDDQQPHVEQGRPLMSLRGMGAQSAWLLVREGCSWPEMRTRRDLAALAGLTPPPYPSGQSQRAQGSSKAGSNRLRWRMVELAWGWLHWPPESALRRWYQERFGQGSTRRRQLGIVALARQLLGAWWRLGAQGASPQGAVLADWDRQVTGRCAKRRPVGTAVAL